MDEKHGEVIGNEPVEAIHEDSTEGILKENKLKWRFEGQPSKKKTKKAQAKENPMSIEESLSLTHESRLRAMRKRQELFLHAYNTIGNFNAGEACRATGIPRERITKWRHGDVWFREKMETIEEEKKDLIESKLLQRVRRNDTAAIIFAAKTKLRDRGYGEHKTVDQKITHELSKEQIDAISRGKRASEMINVTPKQKLIG
ncbi:MAG: hypothetical protein KKD77_23295 [Gammaproteobacteria bacterium]|nr:hypothetical protein [Gammaproteobacteria bacterium]